MYLPSYVHLPLCVTEALHLVTIAKSTYYEIEMNGWYVHNNLHYFARHLQYTLLLSRARNNSRPSAIFRPFLGIWLSKSNLLGQIYYTFSMGKPIIVYI